MSHIIKEQRINKYFQQKNGLTLQIIEYINSKNCTIKWEDGSIQEGIRWDHIDKGNVTKKLRKPSTLEKQRLGNKFVTNEGYEVEVIKYLNNANVTVKYLDGTERLTTWDSLLTGITEKSNKKSIEKIHKLIGKEFKQNCGDILKIIEYDDAQNILIEFTDGLRKNVKLQNIINGQVYNDNLKLKPTFYNFGYFGNGIYSSTDESYQIWRNMLERCLCPIFKEKHPTYSNSTIESEWADFQKFSFWYYTNHPKLPNMIYHLDKDLLIDGNKHYGPETCVIIPEPINCLFIKPSIEKDLPVGVTKYYNGKYVAQLSKEQKRINLGYFNTPEEASEVYMKEKQKHVIEMFIKYKKYIPEKLFNKFLKKS